MAAQRGEVTSHHDLAVRLHRQGRDNTVRPWVEGRVQAAIRVEPPDVVARLPAQRGELAPHHDLAVRLHRQRT